jgi:hypothetical protein
VKGTRLTIALFGGEPNTFAKIRMGDFNYGNEVRIVANDELRTYQPGVDNERCTLVEIRKVRRGAAAVAESPPSTANI